MTSRPKFVIMTLFAVFGHQIVKCGVRFVKFITKKFVVSVFMSC